jgi:hypothetical protein
MCALRKHLYGWGHHTTGLSKKEKLRISFIIDDLEALAEVYLLIAQELSVRANQMGILQSFCTTRNSNGIDDLKPIYP